MFYHAYNGYLNYAYPLDELRPLTCTGMDTWGSFSLTLIDALDTLLIMGNHTEFVRAVDMVLANVNVDANVNVSVFETNIRVVGGLLSAHMLAGKVPGIQLPSGWPCSGPLLDLAESFAKKLLPAFNTHTGMPYGTVNLKYGVNRYETPITCIAGVGTFILEFGALSRLTGNPHYERVALKALKGLWKYRSPLGLVGNHIDVQNGVWTATDSGIGAGVDSYFEYLAKGGLLFQRPLLLHQFYEYEKAINTHVRKEDWFMWVSMTKAQVSLPIFQSLEAFWPGVLVLLGKIEDAAKIMLTYNQIIEQYGVPPEFYNLPNREAVSRRSGYPLRPEIVESLMYLYKTTEDPKFLQIGAGMIEVIEKMSKTSCGYATIRDVTTFLLEDRMESFFLSETSKYLYLLFDTENFIHNDGSEGKNIQTTNGNCVIEAGGYIFNTEAHPLDPGIIYCCSEKHQNDTEILNRFENNIDFLSLLNLDDVFYSKLDTVLDDNDLDIETTELTSDFLGADELNFDENDERLVNNNFNENNIQQENNFEKVETTSENMDLILDGNEEENLLTPPQKSNNESEENFKNEVSILLKKIGDEFSELVKSTDNFEKSSLSGTLTKALKKAQQSDFEPFELDSIEAFCENCCVHLDQKIINSLGLRRMLNIIYGKHIYKNAGIKFIQGPICRPSEEQPSKYFQNPPDINTLESEKQRLDAVTDYSFSTFSYNRLAEERYNLLSSPPRPFSANFMGIGQTVPVVIDT